MAQASVQYTPVQVLQAARRAEAEGKMDYALQFYRHIVEHHGTSVEAQEAREGLFRIAEWRWGEARVARRQEAGTRQIPAGNPGPPTRPAQRVPVTASTPTAIAAVATATAANALQSQQSIHSPHTLPKSPDQAVPMTGVTRMPQIIAREVAKAEARDEPIAFKSRYRDWQNLRVAGHWLRLGRSRRRYCHFHGGVERGCGPSSRRRR